ncbi:MAG: S9 family peptidase, partial [Flavobacterium psychrophilum]
MKKTVWLFLLAGMAATAQKNLTIQEATMGQYQMFAPKSLVAPAWKKDSKTITYLDNSYANLMARSQESNWAESTLISKTELTNALKAKFPADTFELRMFPYTYKWNDANTLVLEVAGKNNAYLVLFDVIKKEIKSAIAISKEAAQQQLSPNGTNASWLKDNNIVISTVDGKTINVTNDTDKGIVNGSDYVHRQEFGIDKGMWWSPKNDKLAYYRKDETMVADYPLTDFSARIAANKNIKYPMAGMKSEEVTLVVYDVNAKKSVTLQTGEPKEQFLTCITWDPNGKFVYIGV